MANNWKMVTNRQQDIEDDLERLAQHDTLTPDQEERWASLRAEWDELDEQRKQLERQADLQHVKRAQIAEHVKKVTRSAIDADAPDEGVRLLTGDDRSGSGSGDPDHLDDVPTRRFRDPWNIEEMRMGTPIGQRTAEYRGRALTAIERMQGTDDKRREVMTRFIERSDTKDGRLAQQLLATSHTDYLRAFGKLMATEGSRASLDAAEQRALDRVESYRAMSLTDAQGGFLVPFQLDPNIINTAAGSFNQIRSVSREVLAIGDTWTGISSAGVTGQWTAEAIETADGSPTLVSPVIPIHKLDVFVPISIEAWMDAANVAQEVAEMIAFEKQRLEAVTFVTGTGTGQPTGIVTALTGTASEVASATADQFAVADLYNLDSALPERYAENATWLAHRAIYNLTRRFDTQGGANLWTTLGEGLPGELLGQRAIRAEAMDSTVTALATNYLLVYGDFSSYVIADRIGTTIEYIPHLFGINRRPTGQRGWYAYARVGADSVNDGAFRMLNA